MINLNTLYAWMGALLLLAAPIACRADTAAGTKAYLDRDFDSALAEFTRSSDQGDVVAKRYLAIMHFQGEGTAKDEARGTKLAHECAQSGDLSCHLMYAESNLMGRGVRADFAEARSWARKAFAAGDARAGMTLAQAYLADPLNQYLVNGRADNARYDALARRTVQERAGQAEALDALAASAASGFTPARLLLSSVLYGAAPAQPQGSSRC